MNFPSGAICLTPECDVHSEEDYITRYENFLLFKAEI